MDCSKVGKLIARMRKEKGMTQKVLADRLHVSDRAVSKWERGMGCPDVSLLHALSKVLAVNIEKLLLGDLKPNNVDGGNMKRIKYYVCPACKTLSYCTGEAEISCCGRKLAPLSVREADPRHQIQVEEIENDYYITLRHEMSKQHYISFIAYVCMDRVLIVKLYPEQSAEVRFPKLYGGDIYLYCTEHGLLKQGK